MLLLDTHIWCRWQSNNELPKRLLEQIARADKLAVSAISCWEIAQLVKRNRLNITMPVEQWVELASINMAILPIDKPIALLSEKLFGHHKDPSDRFIIATAVYYQIPLMSLDTVFPNYDEIAHLLIN